MGGAGFPSAPLERTPPPRRIAAYGDTIGSSRPLGTLFGCTCVRRSGCGGSPAPARGLGGRVTDTGRTPTPRDRGAGSATPRLGSVGIAPPRAGPGRAPPPARAGRRRGTTHRVGAAVSARRSRVDRSPRTRTVWVPGRRRGGRAPAAAPPFRDALRRRRVPAVFRAGPGFRRRAAPCHPCGSAVSPAAGTLRPAAPRTAPLPFRRAAPGRGTR